MNGTSVHILQNDDDRTRASEWQCSFNEATGYLNAI
jgi:hypothetical protein